MKFNLFLLLHISGPACAALRERTDPSGCHADNCLRALRASTRLAQASVDCSSFFDATVTPAPVTVTITSTINGPAKRDSAPTSIPAYASSCADVSEYLSACSCIGVAPYTTTLAPASTTVTAIVTATPSCTAQTCDSGFVPTCDPDNETCYCFQNAEEDGFCGENQACVSLTTCETDADCSGDSLSSGDTCAFSTCCGTSEEGFCLSGSCPNPSVKLARMAKNMARNLSELDTAAFRAH